VADAVPLEHEHLGPPAGELEAARHPDHPAADDGQVDGAGDRRRVGGGLHGSRSRRSEGR
jgi:hypothetical protein